VNVNLQDISKSEEVLDIVRRALAEDIGAGDVTTVAVAPESFCVKAVIRSHGNYVISGVDVARVVFLEMDSRLKCSAITRDGHRVTSGEPVVSIEGVVHGILAAERTALNFMQRMTGIATLTKRFVDKVRPFSVTILDTRKTTPTLRVLEKYAVLCGGGKNHRLGLYDGILIKDNHHRILRRGDNPGLEEAVIKGRKQCPGMEVEVEVENESELESALKAGPDWILLDNMSVEQMERCSALCGGRSRLEASGGITIKNVEKAAGTGIDAISLGCLTHSAPAADLSLDIVQK